MAYGLRFTRRAVKDVDSLDPGTRRRIGETLQRYRDEPFRYARKMASSELGEYRFRIGDHRVIFDLVGDDIVVLRVGHRSQIYRR
ncbi:MAG: type II toxin-antitoxin system RelE/ParE family toxin [Chloroflexi bacterium]|nr:type II toxin-antitoxin system RelE/ParE family toxin [Chloroflexota bacterium]